MSNIPSGFAPSKDRVTPIAFVPKRIGQGPLACLPTWPKDADVHRTGKVTMTAASTAAFRWTVPFDIWRTKFLTWVVVAGLTTVIGALVFLQSLRTLPEAAFSANDWTAFIIFIVVICGIGTLGDPILGTLVFIALRETMADLGTVDLIALGLVAIAVMLKAPPGLWGLIRARTGAGLFPLSFRVTGPLTRRSS